MPVYGAWNYSIQGNSIVAKNNRGKVIQGVFLKGTIAWSEEPPKSLHKYVLASRLSGMTWSNPYYRKKKVNG